MWDAQRNWLVIGFGTSSRTGGPTGKVQSRPPHITCAVSWPDGKLHWAMDNTAQRTWPTQAGLAAPAIPQPLAGTPMERLRRYYAALSKALQQGAFAAQAPANAPAACAAARETREAFLPAAPYANLADFYAAPLRNIDGWLASNCGSR